MRYTLCMQVLVVEDEARIAGFVRRGLEAEGFVVHHATDGPSAVAAAESVSFDAVILDLMLPGFDGEEVLRRIRRTQPQLPVIVLTARDAVSDRVRLLEAGADDYVSKPFSFAELLARLRARLRTAEQPMSNRLSVGDLVLDLRRRQVTLDDRVVDLSAREFALLETFMRHPDQVLSQTILLDRVWGYDYDPGSNVVEVYVGYLRRKLRAELIETVRGVGYRLVG
jgi:DNA-binding response OmpR family regulator